MYTFPFNTQHPLINNIYPFNWLQEPTYPFRQLDESQIRKELQSYERSAVTLPGTKAVAITSVQPSPSETFPNEDRCYTASFPLPNHPKGASANLYMVLDGHAGPDCSDHAIEALPPKVQQAVQRLSWESWGCPYSSDDSICQALAKAMKAFDDDLIERVKVLFGGTEASLQALSDREVQDIIGTPENNLAARRAQKGSTAVVVITVGRHVWSANIGDCSAVIGIKPRGGDWQAKPLYVGLHNGANNIAEKQRIESAHPMEPDVMANNRVLGLIAVTRALGDAMFKMPAIWQSKVWNLLPARNYTKMQSLLERNKTPPYMNAIADTSHYEIPATAEKACLLLASDGLNNPEINVEDNQPHYEERIWIRTLGTILDENRADQSINTASQLLRRLWGYGIGGETVASAFLTLDYKHDHYMDDATLIVVEFEL